MKESHEFLEMLNLLMRDYRIDPGNIYLRCHLAQLKNEEKRLAKFWEKYEKDVFRKLENDSFLFTARCKDTFYLLREDTVSLYPEELRSLLIRFYLHQEIGEIMKEADIRWLREKLQTPVWQPIRLTEEECRHLFYEILPAYSQKDKTKEDLLKIMLEIRQDQPDAMDVDIREGEDPYDLL